VQVSVFGKDVTVRLDNLFRKELVMTSRFASTPRAWRRVMSLVEARRIAFEPLVSGVPQAELIVKTGPSRKWSGRLGRFRNWLVRNVS
jgi:threonine dehydrogenase-like Zn-dependent dehydrogenase